MKAPAKNIAASIRDRLLKLSKLNHEEFSYTLMRYALERLLIRLASSKYRSSFVLKGAMLFRVWSPMAHRPTKDVDLLGTGSSEPVRLAEIFREISIISVDDDGLAFDENSVRATPIKEDAEYQGVRVNVTAHLGTARMEIQIDIGFGDAVTPIAIEIDYPTLLPSLSSPRLYAYPKETVIAEKFQAMVHLGIGNSRMKDFFDIWFLASNFEFDGEILARAIRATFERRKTSIPTTSPLALTERFFYDDAKMKQWRAFVGKNSFLPTTTTLETVVTAIAPFLVPPLEAIRAERAFYAKWNATGSWSIRE